MKRYRLEELVDIEIGRTPSRSVPEYFGKGYPWVSISDLNKLGGGKYISKTKEELTSKGVSESKIKKVRKGTLLYSFKLSIGKIAISATDLYTNEAIAALSIKDPNITFAEFLFYALQNLDYSRFTDHAVMGKTLNKRKLKELTIDLPEDLNTQHQIVAALNKAKALIDKRQQSIEMLDELLRATFLDMFGDTYLNPNQWPVKKLNELCSIQSGLTLSQSKRAKYPVTVPYLRVANVLRGRINIEELKTLKAQEKEVSRTELQKGDILVVEGHGNIDEIGRVAMWEFDGDEKIVHQNHLIRLRVNSSELSADYLADALNSNGGIRKIKRIANTTSGLNTISTGKLKHIQIPSPPKDLQNIYTSRTGLIKEQKTKLEKSLDGLNDLFQSLLQRAFHGDLVVDADLQLEGLLESRDYEGIVKDETLVKKLVDRLNQSTELKKNEIEDCFKFSAYEKYKQVYKIIERLLEDKKVGQVYDEISKKLELVAL